MSRRPRKQDADPQFGSRVKARQDFGALSNSAPRKALQQSKRSSDSSGEVPREQVAVRAYYLWERSGRAHGRDLDHWLQAETQLRRENGLEPRAAASK